MALLYALMALCFFGRALAQVTKESACPQVKTMQNFEISKMVGKWYEAERTLQPASNVSIECATIDYNLHENSDVRVIWTLIDPGTNYSTSMSANVHVPDSSNPAKTKVKFIGSNYEGDMEILGTDYVSFAVLFYCSNGPSERNVHIYLWTRDQKPADAVIGRAYEIIQKNVFNISDSTKIKKTHCILKRATSN